MKIVVLTCVWRRPDITKVFLEQFKALKDYNPGEFELELVVVGSEAKSKEIITPHTKHYIHHKNLPLGNKWNAGLGYCKQLDFDYLLILGSDDILTPSALDVYKRYTDEGFEYLGFEDFYVYNTQNKKAAYWPGYTNKRAGETIGAGRLIARSILEKVDFNLWLDYKNKGLDASATKKLLKLGIKCRSIKAKNNQVFLVDLKSKQNLGKYDRYADRHVNAKNLIANHFPHLKKMIFKL